MGDRIDEQYGRELQQEARVERQADLKAAGDLLNPQEQKQLQNFLVQNCWMKPADAQDAMDTINSLAGEKGAKALGVIKDSLEGHVPAKFLANDSNFKPITEMLTNAIAGREARIEALHAAPAATAPTAKAAPAAPKQGG